ncbi:MAG: hypothetical protein EBS05_23355 [Proteobacteria bacterium]|nr:hypothetical protein [Pseudomonadota bacterium]NDF01579.1 hypothetical protein [Verrucomicrobiota bacterium]
MGTGRQLTAAFRSAEAFSSWMGLCPDNRIRGSDGDRIHLACVVYGLIKSGTNYHEAEAFKPTPWFSNPFPGRNLPMGTQEATSEV